MSKKKVAPISRRERKMPKTEGEWKQRLTPEQYHILREKGTELPFTGKYNLHKERGMYVCAGCGAELFSSGTKFESHCGWPAFFEGISKNIGTREDNSHFMSFRFAEDLASLMRDKRCKLSRASRNPETRRFRGHRIEVFCKNCQGHLGHVFDDGPAEHGGKRFCINSLALDFEDEKTLAKKK